MNTIKSILKAKDEDYIQFLKVKRHLMVLYHLKQSKELTYKQYDRLYRNFDEFKRLYAIMKSRYNKIHINQNFKNWLNEIDEIEED